ncbi:hypothetical protein ONZ45_g16281 [Pleurotus djamor]|nr:hypothetical protein ONZ45_g16281 [Pleurotus djamor]
MLPNGFMLEDSPTSLAKLANAVSARVLVDLKKESQSQQFLRFAHVADVPQEHPTTRTECRAKVPWPCMEVTCEVASDDKSRDQRRQQGLSDAYYLLMARPDRHIVPGMYFEKDHFDFIFAVSGVGLQICRVDRKEFDPVLRLLHKMIFRMYRPGPFADPTCAKVPGVLAYTYPQLHHPDGKTSLAGYDYTHKYASAPFHSRTNVLVNPTSPIPVIKDQYARKEIVRHEYDMLQHIHKKPIIGVVTPRYFCEVDVPHLVATIRGKSRLGFAEHGQRFMDVPNVQTGLEVLYDTLEIIRHLYREPSQVLHRDISSGNVCWLANPVSSVPEGAHKEDVCYIKFLLGKSPNMLETHALLIDYNRAQKLGDLPSQRHTGTPIFTSRAIENGAPLDWANAKMTIVEQTPALPDVYALAHPSRETIFPQMEATVVQSRPSNHPKFTHALHHDAESIFWLLVYWALLIQPKGAEGTSFIKASDWGELHGDYKARNAFMLNSSTGMEGSLDPAFAPLGLLIKQLASMLTVDYYWMDEESGRTHPEFVHETFQRSIFDFLSKNMDEAILPMIPISSHPRSHLDVDGEAYSSTYPYQWINIDY